MEIEVWALVVSFIALFVSIGIPIWQWKVSNKQKEENKRTVLLQRILEVKTIQYFNYIELHNLLSAYGKDMNIEKKELLNNTLLKMKREVDEIEGLHVHWSNYNDGKSLSEIEQEISIVDLMVSEATSMTKIIETDRDNFEKRTNV
ncbi:hypothetical protein [Candidatus Thiodiazotropha sp. CDECU1]|uniref:hypothetical protein n=1 Tax=Candidatus Thiodiazotropha sp. CDECU1 TaxID=3065865 RepID=UPI0029311685|nr:hypothetical protein [Candidatus Thiodiazotropha sp. CDECU1]